MNPRKAWADKRLRGKGSYRQHHYKKGGDKHQMNQPGAWQSWVLNGWTGGFQVRQRRDGKEDMQVTNAVICIQKIINTPLKPRRMECVICWNVWPALLKPNGMQRSLNNVEGHILQVSDNDARRIWWYLMISLNEVNLQKDKHARQGGC